MPNHLHKEWVIKSAEHGKHVLCENPAALTVEGGKEMIKAGEIGDAHYMEAGFSFILDDAERATNIRMDRVKGGGSIYDIGCYALHSIRHLLDSEPTSVNLFANIDEEMGVDTATVAYLTMENGVRATFNRSFHLPMRHEYRIFGTEGTITIPRAY